jgi:hypothetical protein
MFDNFNQQVLDGDSVKAAAISIFEKYRKAGDKISENGCINLSIDERKILLSNTSIEAVNQRCSDDSKFDKNGAFDLVYKLSNECFNEFDYLVGLTPNIVYKGKSYESRTEMLRHKNTLNDLKIKMLYYTKKNKMMCLYCFDSFGKAANADCNHIPVIRYYIVDFNYKSYLVNKRFNQNDKERKFFL